MLTRTLAFGSLLALTLAACGDDTHRSSSSDGGWVTGNPDRPAATDAESATADTAAGSGPMTDDESAAASTIPPAADPKSGSATVAVPRAGSVDDNAQFDDYLTYLTRLRERNVALRDFDPTGRIVVTVRGSSGLPVAGADIAVAVDGADVARLRTTANGTARFHPALYGVSGSGEVTFTTGAGGDTVAGTATSGGSVTLTSSADGGATGSVPVDVLFLLDATGSMGDEIDQLKATIDSVAAQVEQLQSDPDVRFGMTLYRDMGDEFVTTTFDFTADVVAFRDALADVSADGGGDYAEALDEGLAEALTVPTWRDPSTTLHLVFLVGDAPPQIARQVATPYPESIRTAIANGTKIFPVASSETDDQAEAVFRQLAQATGSRFVFLSYGAAGAATGASTDIERTDYEEMALDQLVVRLISEELAALTGTSVEPPSPDTVPATNPEGQ